MRRLIEKKKLALEMRKLGMSYSKIKGELKVSKASLSVWLRDFPLSDERIRELRDFNVQRIERYINTRRLARETRLKDSLSSAKNELIPLTQQEIYVGGLMLYWGEGSKTQLGTVSLSNTDPEVIKFFLYWLTIIVGVPRDKIKIRLHLYSDMNVQVATNFWSTQLELTRESFKPPYIKASTLAGLTYKGHGHGTCNVITYNTELHMKILSSIKAISSYRITEKMG